MSSPRAQPARSSSAKSRSRKTLGDKEQTDVAGQDHRSRHRARPSRPREPAASMKAVRCKDTRLEVVDLPEPAPGKGQVVLEVLRCGICGSDLHARHHSDELADVLAAAGYDGFMRADQEVVFGHEFCGQVAEYGPGCQAKFPTGTAVVALPLLRRGSEIHATGLSSC